MADEDEQWVMVQKKAFTKWANSYLRKRKLEINNVYEDLGDGILVNNLLGVLGKTIMTQTKEPRVNPRPRMRIHKLENLKYGFDYMRAEDVKMVNIGAEDIIDGNRKIILALLWSLIVRYSVDTISMDGISGKEGLLLWCQRQTKGYRDVDVKNFHKSWADGAAFCALLDRFGGRVGDFMSKSVADRLATAFQVAEDQFGLDMLMDVEDITEVDKPDDKVIMTYLSTWFKYFAERMKGDNLVKAIHTAIEVTKRHDTWIGEYNTKGNLVKVWVGEKGARFGNLQEGASGFGDTSIKVKDNIDSFYAYKKDEKPSKKGDLSSLEGSLAKIHSSQRPNGRDEFEPESAIVPASLNNQWGNMETNENTYESALRKSYAHFLTLEALAKKFNQKHNKSVAWLTKQKGVFDAGMHGKSAIECEGLLDNLIVLQEQLVLQEQTAEDLRSIVNHDRMNLHQLHPELQRKMKELDDLLAATKAAMVQYKKSVTTNKQEFSKLVILMKPATWMEEQLNLFDTDVEKEGTTSVKVAVMLEVFKESFTDEVGVHEMTLQRMRQLLNPAAMDAGVKGRLDELDSKMSAVKTKAGDYERQLLERQHVLAELVDLIKEFNCLCTEFSHAVDVLEEELSAPLIANSVQEAQALADRFQEETQPAVDAIKQQFKQIHEIGMQLHESPEEEAASAFSQYDLNSLNAKGGSAVKAIMEYQNRLMGEGGFLETEMKKEKLRKQFADGANAFKKFCEENTTETRGDLGKQLNQTDNALLGSQLAAFETRLTACQAKEEDLKALQPVADALEEQGVITNPHTPETMYSLQTMHTLLLKLVTDAIATTKEKIELNKFHEGLIAEYTGIVTPFREWLDKTLTRWDNTAEGKDGFGDTTAQIKEKLDSFYAYKKDEKQAQQHVLTQSKEVSDKLYSSQRKHNHPLYQAEAGKNIVEIESSWAKLNAKEDVYDKAVRDSYLRWQMLDNTIARFYIKKEKILAWASSENDTFRAQEYGNSSVAVDALLDNFNLYEQQMELFREPLEGMLTDNGMEMHAEHPVVAKEAAELESSLQETNGLAEKYNKMLQLNKHEFEKLKMMMKPEKWIEKCTDLVSGPDRGATTQEVTHLIANFKETYTDEKDSISQTLTYMKENLNAEAPPNAGVTPKVEELLQKMSELNSKAAAYEQDLLARQKKLLELVGNVRDYNKQATKLMFALDNLEDEFKTDLTPNSEEEAQAIVDRYNTELKSEVESNKQKLGGVTSLGESLAADPEEESKNFDSSYTVADMETKMVAVEDASKQYGGGLEALLKGEREKEELRKQFAKGAQELKAQCEKVSKEVSGLDGELEEQLETLISLKEKPLKKVHMKLESLQPLSDQMEEKGITNNPHTPETIYSLRATVDVLDKLFDETEDLLQRNIAAEKSGGLSPEMYQEIKEVFDHFDESGDGQLDRNEFGTCTTAVGLMLSEEDTAKYMDELDTSGDGLISFEEFIAFMQNQLSASGTSKADVMDAFAVLAKAGEPAAPKPAEGEEAAPAEEGPKVIKKSKIESNFPESSESLEPPDKYAGDAQYMLTKMPAGGGDGSDPEFLYTPFVDDMFTR